MFFFASCGRSCHLYSSQKSFQWTHPVPEAARSHHMDVACNYCNTLLFVEYCSDPNSKYSTFIYFISSSKLNLLNNFDRIYRKMYQHIQYSKSVALNSPWTYLDGIFVIYLNLYTLIYFLKFRLKITKFVLDQAKIKCNLFITRTGYLQMEKKIYQRGSILEYKWYMLDYLNFAHG